MKPTQLLNDDGSASMATMIMLSHHAFRRDLARFRTALRTFDGTREAALREEWAQFAGALHGHHAQEDAAIFPSAKKDHPAIATAIDHLSDQHHRIDPLLARCKKAFDALPGTTDALSAIEELGALLDAHLDMEEAVLIPTLRDFKEFPVPPDAAMAAMYADGFAWAMNGIAPAVLDKVHAMLPPNVRELLPAAVDKFHARCERVWGHTLPLHSTTSNPGV
ncbi:MAG: hemerythrin domain-containing protein [Kofleriaceae bacterium]